MFDAPENEDHPFYNACTGCDEPGKHGNPELDVIELAHEVLEMIASSGPGDPKVKAARLMIVDAGLVPGIHVGADDNTFDDPIRIAEWWLGQVANLIDTKSWFAMNSLLNWGEARLPERSA